MGNRITTYPVDRFSSAFADSIATEEKMQRGKIILAAVLALATLGANSTGYHVFKKVALPGAGGWDY